MYEEKKMDDKGDKMESKAATYSLSLNGEGISLDREINQATALDVISLVMSGNTTTVVGAGEGAAHRDVRPQRQAGRGSSLGEYLDEVAAKRNVDKILAIADYIENETGKSFTSDDVRSRFQVAKEKVPGNYSRDFAWTVRNRWIAAVSGTPGEYYVTSTGHEALKEKFSPEIKKKTGVNKGARGGKRSAKRNGGGDAS